MPRLRHSLLAVVLLAACRAVTTPFDYPDDLRHPNFVKRSKAVGQFAELKDGSQLPEAFQLLLDKEAPIRSVAYRTIKSLMPGGEDFGYRPYLDEDVRVGIVARWEAWWRERRSGGGATETGRG